MHTTESIIGRWPTMTDLADDLGVLPDIVRMWKHRDSIPAYHWPRLVEAARARDLDVTLEMLAACAAAKREPRQGEATDAA